MKKILKGNAIGLFLGAIVFSTVGVYAAKLFASEVSYTNNEQETVQGAIDDLYTKVGKDSFFDNIKCENGETCIASQLHIGDYVKITPSLTSYNISTVDTGYSSDQTINPSELNIWRVISINNDGTVDAVSEYVSSINVYFGGKEGSQNYIGTLNKIAAAYTNPSYVIRTRHMGYGGGTSYITDTTKLEQTTAPWSANTSSSITLADEKKGGGDIGYEYDYNLVKSISYAKANKVGTSTKTAYWLASRFYDYVGSTYYYSGGRCVGGDGSDSRCCRLYGYHGSYFISYECGLAIRPIITLKSGLTISGGSGTSSFPWTFS